MAKEWNLLVQLAHSGLNAVTQRLNGNRQTSPRVADNMRRDARCKSRKSSTQHQWRQRHIIIGAMDVQIEPKSMRQVHQRSHWVPRVRLDEHQHASGLQYAETLPQPFAQEIFGRDQVMKDKPEVNNFHRGRRQW